MAPRVSIVTATFDRSHLLDLALEGVQGQTYRDFEHVVVGDACTDDTARVVGDRARFVNRAENAGEQSAPNNDGVRLAKGELIAFLNDDDLWTPDHLAGLVRAIDETGADLVFARAARSDAGGAWRLTGVTAAGRYQPHLIVPASTWLIRRSLWEAVGPWRGFRECYNFPSQDWLFRAHRMRRTLLEVPQLSVFAIPSGERRGSYTRRDASEHRALVARMRDDPRFRERELLSIAAAHARDAQDTSVRTHLRRAAASAMHRAALAAGVSPLSVRHALKGLAKGAEIDRLRAVRGLPRLERRRP